MPEYEVKIRVTRNISTPIIVYAADEAGAEEKAVDIVLKWDGIEDAEAVEVEEV